MQKNRQKGGFSRKGGPSDRIRTCGILLPKQARYQLRYTRLYTAAAKRHHAATVIILNFSEAVNVRAATLSLPAAKYRFHRIAAKRSASLNPPDTVAEVPAPPRRSGQSAPRGCHRPRPGCPPAGGGWPAMGHTKPAYRPRPAPEPPSKGHRYSAKPLPTGGPANSPGHPLPGSRASAARPASSAGSSHRSTPPCR